MDPFHIYNPSQTFAPSAPPLLDSSSASSPKPSSTSSSPSYSSSYNPGGVPPPSGYPYAPPPLPPPSQTPYGYSAPPFPGSGGGGGGSYFPPDTHPEIVRNFQAVDRDRSGCIDESELQVALSSGYQKFSIRTVRLLMFLFKNPNNGPEIGPVEFTTLWNCLGQWRAIFERFDRDRSGEIDSAELKDALLSLGSAVPPTVIQLLISKYNDGSGSRSSLNFDSFVECGMIVKGLTEKFKEKDMRHTGSATLTYETFMTMIIPFIVP